MHRKSFLKRLLGIASIPFVAPYVNEVRAFSEREEKIAEQTRIEQEKLKKFYPKNTQFATGVIGHNGAIYSVSGVYIATGNYIPMSG